MIVKISAKRVLLDRQCKGPGVWSGRGCPEDRGCAAITKCGEVEVRMKPSWDWRIFPGAREPPCCL